MKRLLLILILISTTFSFAQKSAKINFNKEIPQVAFAVQEIEAALKTNTNFKAIIQFKLETNSYKAEGYSIKKTKPTELTIVASDANGLMYGGLELAELIRIKEDFSTFTEVKDAPYISKRYHLLGDLY